MKSKLFVVYTGAMLACCVLISSAAHAQQSAPIEEVKGLVLDRAVFDASQVGKPIEVTKAEVALKLFGVDGSKALLRKVDLKSQRVLVFAWKGSGQDALSYAVAESAPEQVFFSYKPGFTRDLREHARIFVLRSDVKWSIASKDDKR